MGEMHVTYKQVGFMQMKPVGGKSWRKSGWVWQPGMKAEIQWLLQCLQFLLVGEKKSLSIASSQGSRDSESGKPWVLETFLSDFSYIPLGARG